MIYITGTNGFVGKNFTNLLEKKEVKYYSLKRKKKLGVNNKTSYANFPKTSKSSNKILIHLASPSVVKLYRKKNYTDKEILNCFENEIDSIISLIKFYKKNNFKKLIYISTSSIYGKRKYNSPFKETDNPNPNDFYSRIKLAVEMIIKKEVKNYIILRPFQIYGKFDFQKRLIPTLVQAKKNQKLQLQDCLQVTDLIHVQDVCEIIYKLCISNIKNHIFNLGSGKPIRLRNIVKIISKIRGNCFKYSFKNLNSKQITNFCYADTTQLFSKIKYKLKKFPVSRYEIY